MNQMNSLESLADGLLTNLVRENLRARKKSFSQQNISSKEIFSLLKSNILRDEPVSKPCETEGNQQAKQAQSCPNSDMSIIIEILQNWSNNSKNIKDEESNNASYNYLNNTNSEKTSFESNICSADNFTFSAASQEFMPNTVYGNKYEDFSNLFGKSTNIFSNNNDPISNNYFNFMNTLILNSKSPSESVQERNNNNIYSNATKCNEISTQNIVAWLIFLLDSLYINNSNFNNINYNNLQENLISKSPNLAFRTLLNNLNNTNININTRSSNTDQAALNNLKNFINSYISNNPNINAIPNTNSANGFNNNIFHHSIANLENLNLIYNVNNLQANKNIKNINANNSNNNTISYSEKTNEKNIENSDEEELYRKQSHLRKLDLLGNSESSRLKNFKCHFNECEKAYKTRENLTLHIKNKHLGVKPYACKYCNAKFSHRNGIYIFK